MNTILALKDIRYSYQDTKCETCAIQNISLDVKKGEFISIVGPSGCGKSTLLSIIAGIIAPDSGDIFFHYDSSLVSPVRPIGYMLQHDNLLEWRDVYQNCILGLEIHHALSSEHTTYVRSLLNNYGLSSFMHKKPSELSGGMRQRVALIRTLVLKPELLLLDEPFSALDYQTRLVVSQDICNKIRAEGKTTILVTHDLSEAISLSDRIYVLSPRPAVIKDVFDIHLTLDPQDPLSARKAPEFQYYFQKVWEALYGA